MEQLLESRIHFFRRYHSDAVTRQFLVNEARFLSLLEHRNRMDVIGLINAHIPRNIRLEIPPEFFDNIPVIPSAEELRTRLRPDETPVGSCPICQEAYNPTDEVVTLRNCNHTFHRLCANAWYSRSVFCPLCRNDIRTNLEQANTN